MASKRRRRRPRLRAEPAGAKVYVPVIHGVGTATLEDWVSHAIEPMASWCESCRGATRVGCATGCRLSKGHVHLKMEGRRGPLRVDIDPVFWSIPEPGGWRAAWTVLQVALLVGLLDIVAFAPRILRPLVDRPPQDDWLTLRADRRSIRYACTFIVRAMALPLLAVIAAGASLAIPRVRRKLSDALVWVIDDDERERLVSAVVKRIDGRDDCSVVLVGHSQGGSIAAEVELRVRDRREVSLVTLGTGHALLKMLHVVTPSWSLWRSIAVWGLLACWLAGLGVVFLAVAHLASTDLVTWIAAVARIGGAMWLWDVDAGGATQVMQDGWRRMGAITVTGMPMSIVQLTLEVGLIGGAAVLLGRCLVGSRGHELWQALHTGARGVDIIATHDPVSLSMLTLGELDRVYAVSQTGSTVFDHVTYFENTPLVMPAIVSQIDEAARADAIRTNAGERLLRRGLATRRAMRPLALACGWVVFSALLVVWPWPASLIVVAALLVAASIAVSWRCRRWLRTVAAVSDAAPAVVVRAAMIREHGRSRGWALLQAMLAVPMIGGGAMTLTLGYSSGSSQALAAVQPLSGLAFLLGLAIALTAWMAGCGSRRADRVATFVLGGASLLWTQHHTHFGTFMAAIYFATAAWAAVRLMRFPDPLRAPIAA